jgi:hypothetical protein
MDSYSQQYPLAPQQYASPPSAGYQAQTPPQYYPPPQQPTYNTSAGYAEIGEQPLYANDKIKPSSGFKDVWATVLWLCNMAAFIALSVIGIRGYSQNKGSTGGGTPPNSGNGITFDTDTVKVFGLSVIVGFGLSFLYLIIANL